MTPGIDYIAGWAGVLTGIGTSGLAIATFKLAGRTRQTVEQAELQARRAEMPVVMPVADIRSHAEESGMPKLQGEWLIIPVNNVGTGPAFQLAAEVEFGDAVGEPSPAGMPMSVRRPQLAALGVGQFAAMSGRYRGLADSLLSFRLTLTWTDALGGAYKLTAVYVEEGERQYRQAIVIGWPEQLQNGGPKRGRRIRS